MTGIKSALSVSLAALALAGCGGGTDAPPERNSPAPGVESATSTPVDPSEPVAEEMTSDEIAAWVEDVFSSSPKRINAARRSAVEGSIADTFATYRLHSANSNIDGGYPQEPQNVATAGSSFETCPPDDADACTTLDQVKQMDGLIESFTINGTKLEKRVVAGPGKPISAAGQATVQFLVAYRTTSSDTLVVAVKLTAGGQPITILDASYRAPNGRQSQSENISGPQDLQARSSATYTMGFPGAVPGGSASLRFYTDGAPIPATVSVTAAP